MSTENLNIASPNLKLPGSILKQAREAKGLSVDEMAAISNLTKQVIRGIESDVYDELAGLSFVRGYLRLYAKKLGINESSILEPFDAWKRHQVGEPAVTSPAKEFESHSMNPQSSRVTRGWIWSGAGILISLVATGTYISIQDDAQPAAVEELDVSSMHSSAPESYGNEVRPLGLDGVGLESDDQDAAVSDVQQQASEVAPKSEQIEAPNLGTGLVNTEEQGKRGASGADQESTTLDTPVNSGSINAIPRDSDVATTESLETERSTPSVQDVRLPERPTVERVAEDESSPDGSSVIESPVVEVDELQPAASQVSDVRVNNRDAQSGLRVLSETVAGAATPEESLGPVSRLQMRFTGDSWVEVRNAQGRLILADLMRADRDVLLNIQGPVELLVGAVDASIIVFNGERLDLSAQAYQNVARVTLGAVRN